MYFAFFKRHSHIKLPTIILFITFVFSLYLCNVNLTSASSNEDLSTQDLLLISLAKNEMTPVELEKLANAGDADAQFMLGSFHYFGKGVPSNKSIAMHWFEKASVNGNSKAQLMLGMMYAYPVAVAIGFGIAGYGFAYFLVHEVFIHRRLSWFRNSDNVYLRAIRKAHKVHHKKLGKEDGECFGMLIVPFQYFIEARKSVRQKQKAAA